MKKLSIILTAVLTVIVTSCNLDLKPLTGPSTEGFPSSRDEAISGLYAAYYTISTNRGNNTGSWWRTMDAITDIGSYRTGSNLGPLARGTANTENVWFLYMYKHAYETISAIHLTLDGLDKLAGEIDEREMACIKAELLVMRTWYYDQLAQYYGAVPYITKRLNLSNMSTPRMPLDELIPHILDDIPDEVIDALPDRWDMKTYGTARLSRVAAYMIKARIYMNYAGEDFANGYWAEAAKYSAKAITIAEASGHALSTYDTQYYATHADGEPLCKLFSYEGQTDDEWIWCQQYNEMVDKLITINIYYNASRTLNGAAFLGPSQHLIDAFQCTDGKPITISSSYNWENPWANRDPRLDLFCVRDGSRTMGVEFTLDATQEKVQDYNTGTMVANADSSPKVNKYEYGTNGSQGPGGYLWRKGYDPSFYGNITGGNTSSTHDCINQGLLRLAELYLIDAEANIEMPGGDLNRAKTMIENVRLRAGMPQLTVTDRDGLRKALRYERMAELCGEGLRWYDIRRWGIAAEAMNRTAYAPGFSSTSKPKNYISNAKPTIDDNWLVTYDGVTTWNGEIFNLRNFCKNVFVTGRDEHFAIPQQEIDANTAISITDQNPGY